MSTNESKGSSLLDEIKAGFSPDQINLKRVAAWFFLGIVIVAISLYGLMHMYEYNRFVASQNAAIRALYPEQNARLFRENRQLNSLEVIDAEERLFRIPIDSAMTLVVTEYSERP